VAAHAHYLASLPHQYAAAPSSSPFDDLAVASPSSGASPLSSDPATVLSQLETADALFDISSLDSTGSGLMPELWHDNLVPRSTGRSTHNRDVSLSSFGSVAGPASPYSRTSANPRIAVNDSSLDDLADLHAGVDAMAHNHYSIKSYGGQPADVLYGGMPVYHPIPNADQSVSLMPPTGGAASSRRSRPVSVASSIMSDSPATPSLGDPEDHHVSHPASTMAAQTIPKLARTVTDAYGDELYSPNFHLTPSKQSPGAKADSARNNDIFAQALQAANHFGMHPTQPYQANRGHSPFREGAPLAPVSTLNMVAARTSGGAPRIATPTSGVSTDTARSAGGAYGLAQAGGHPSEPNTPHTISPKDTFLEFQPEGDDDFTLFGPSATPFGAPDVGKYQQTSQNTVLLPAGQPRQPATNFGYYPAQAVSYDVQSRLPQQYPFIRQQQMPLVAPGVGRGAQPLGEVRHPTQPAVGLSNKPTGASADGGTYTCTYHGCSLRFETPALLQKHKREGHRQAHGLNSAGRRLESTATTGLFNTQSGPHKCDRINPTTGKPCNTVFSRPYDLTRHEDTIHNIRKLKVRCEICTEEKTFSRADALTRHFRVCHPGVDIPTKHRKRVGH